ncbi:MAG: alpha/beta hydrolase family protein [Bdellovibrionales bacterium]
MKILFSISALLFSVTCLASTYPVTKMDSPFSGSRYYVPNDAKKHTSIVMLHGSEGGSVPYIDGEANLLAAQGYAVLVLCYFDCNRGINGPRQTLENVNPAIVLDAVAWLRVQGRSDSKVYVYGFSRGAELALIVGSLPMTPANHPNGIVAHSPSDVFNSAWNWDWQEPACWICKAGANQCQSSSPQSAYDWNSSCGQDPRAMDFSRSAWVIAGRNIPSETRIEIEKYDGPILITVGEADEVWPVDQTKRIEKTLQQAGRPAEIHYFPNQGHVFRGPDETTRRELVVDFIRLHEEIPLS